MDLSTDYLLANSNLPGPRSNLELLYRFTESASPSDISKCMDFDQCSPNTPEEFVLSCGISASIFHAASQHQSIDIDIKHYANHESWRARESVCIGFQKSKPFLKSSEMLSYLEPLKLGSELEMRTYMATICEPILLKSYIDANEILEYLYQITTSHFSHGNKLNESQQVLKKALGYCWSVALCGENADRVMFEKLIDFKSYKHINWIITENLKKKRLEKLDSQWVVQLRELCLTKN